MELALEIGAEDISIEEETYEIYSQPDLFAAIREEIENREVSLVAQELAMLPQNQIKVGGDKAPQLLKLMEALEDQEDVQHVWANFDIDADVLASQAG